MPQGSPVQEALPQGFWDAIKIAVTASASEYPYLTVLTLCAFGLALVWLGGRASYLIFIGKDKIKYDYKSKELQATYRLERLKSKSERPDKAMSPGKKGGHQ